MLMKLSFVLSALLCGAPFAWAQTDAQLPALKAAIVADPQLNAYPNTGDGNFALAECLSRLTTLACTPWPGQQADPAGPVFVVWRSRVQIDEVGDNINAAELAGLSTLNATRLQTLVALSNAGINPSIANRRTFFDDIFSGAGGVNTRAALLILWKRPTNRVEAFLKAGGTGSDASPATLGFEGATNYQRVEAARNLP